MIIPRPTENKRIRYRLQNLCKNHTINSPSSSKNKTVSESRAHTFTTCSSWSKITEKRRIYGETRKMYTTSKPLTQYRERNSVAKFTARGDILNTMYVLQKTGLHHGTIISIISTRSKCPIRRSKKRKKT